MLDYNKIEKIDCESQEYPDSLREIKNPPRQLYCLGDTALLKSVSAAVVGSRKFTLYGKNVACMIGRRFAESGVPVVSGLANGIDSFAHIGVLEAGGKGIGVLGSGIKMMGPSRNRQLMFDLLDAGGLVVSEYDPEMAAEPWTFPQRNRIISGLSKIVVVVEANYNSGALITAQHANEQGRMIFAVPGNINSQFSMGSNLLIRDGAIPLIVIDDAIRELGYTVQAGIKEKIKLGDDEIKVISEIRKYNGVSPDVVAKSLKMRVSELNAIITVLEIKGVVEIYCGKIHLAKEI